VEGVPPRLRWSLVTPVLVLAGLFGMHGLGDHSTAHPALAMPSHSMAVAATGAMVVGAEAVAALPDDGMSGMGMGLCVAILLGGLVAWLSRAGSGRRTPWALPRAALTSVPVPRSRAPDPPTPALLSVYRC
jgi:hypothetical protein